MANHLSSVSRSSIRKASKAVGRGSKRERRAAARNQPAPPTVQPAMFVQPAVVASGVSPDRIRLNGRRRRRLRRILARRSSPQALVLRASIVLAAAAGHENARIGRDLGVHVDTVRKWRHRYASKGIAGLRDLPRSGRPLVYGIEAQLMVVATVTEQHPEIDTHWSHRLLADQLHDTVGISASQIGRLLAGLDLKPHRVRGWLNRPPEPDFLDRATAICALYRADLAPNTVFYSIDEKTGIQAVSRKHPDQPIRAGRPLRREFEYVRHGVVNLMAAMNVKTGTITGKIIDRNDSVTFIEFLTELQARHPAGTHIQIILDGGSSHRSHQTRQWLSEHPEFTIIQTPKHSSWLNVIEIWFSILTRRILRRGSFTSQAELSDKIERFIAIYNRKAKPIRWTYDAKLLKAA